MASLEASEFSLSIKTNPQSQAAKPKGPAYSNSFLATTVHFFITGHSSNIPLNKDHHSQRKTK